MTLYAQRSRDTQSHRVKEEMEEKEKERERERKLTVLSVWALVLGRVWLGSML